MSRDRDKPDAPGPIPPELAPYLRKRAWPRTQKLGEDPALDAAAEAYTARDSELGIREERPAQDLSIGMGNASAYVAPAEVPAAMVPSSASEGAPKVEVAMADIPRALPSGSRTAQTVEVKIVRPPPGGVGDAAGRGPTIMGTARLPAIKEASPWATEAAPVTPPIAPVELPSAHAPAATREHGAEPPRSETRGRAKGLLLAGAVLVLAVLVVLRVAVTHHNDGGIAATTASATTTAPPPPSTEPSASAAPSPPVTTGEPAIEASAAPTTAPPRAPAARKPRNALDDPYDAAVAPLPPETAAPAPPPAPPPAATPAKPTAPPPDDDEIYHRPKRKSP